MAIPSKSPFNNRFDWTLGVTDDGDGATDEPGTNVLDADKMVTCKDDGVTDAVTTAKVDTVVDGELVAEAATDEVGLLDGVIVAVGETVVDGVADGVTDDDDETVRVAVPLTVGVADGDGVPEITTLVNDTSSTSAGEPTLKESSAISTCMGAETVNLNVGVVSQGLPERTNPVELKTAVPSTVPRISS